MSINLELRSIKHSRSLSHETPAYTAAIFVNGKKVATVENSGHGGCDFVYWIDAAAEEKVKAHFKALPPMKFKEGELEWDL